LPSLFQRNDDKKEATDMVYPLFRLSVFPLFWCVAARATSRGRCAPEKEADASDANLGSGPATGGARTADDAAPVAAAARSTVLEKLAGTCQRDSPYRFGSGAVRLLGSN